jgi:hypothetical protein
MAPALALYRRAARHGGEDTALRLVASTTDSGRW